MGACRSQPKPPPQDEVVREELVTVNNVIGYDSEQSTRRPSKEVDPATDSDHAAEESELQWVNYMITVMWPFVRQAMIKKAGEKFHEKMNEELAKHPQVQIEELTLDFDPGSKPPRILGLIVYQRTQQERNGLQVDVDFVWKADSEFHMRMTIRGHAKAFPINAEGVGVSAMEVSGTMSCLMAPLLEVEPCVGTGQAFFLDQPQINMKVAGMKALGPLGGVLTNVMEGVVKNVLQEGYILPHRFVQKVRKDLPLETMVTMKSPLPLGLLMVEVLEGRNLPASDTSITGKKSSDPFVEIKVGCGKVRSSTVENNLNPKWSDPPGHLFVYNVAQLVRITVSDDDIMGGDHLGTVVGYNVFLLMQEQAANKDGVWHKLVDKANKPAGEIKLRVRYFDVADIGELKAPTTTVPSNAPPYLLTVKLLGLEAEDRGDLRNTRVDVEVIHPVQERSGKEQVDHEAHRANRLMMGFESAMSWAKTAVKHATGIEVGFGSIEDGVPTKRKSGKAMLWGSQKQLEDAEHHVIPPMAIRAMEKLHIREGWPITKVANMFQLEPEVVRTAVEMRGNFEVVWHEALHFLQPAANPFLGTVKISVQAPASNQVRGADDHGFLGEFEIDLSAAASAEEGGEGPWKRRIRQMLVRPKSAKAVAADVAAKRTSRGETEASSSTNAEPPSSTTEAEECTGVVIELMVEVRKLDEAACELDQGQNLRSKESLIKATTTGGVRMIPE